jgi:hypothetical protein
MRRNHGVAGTASVAPASTYPFEIWWYARMRA